jgi:hypothetical protein
MHYFNGLGDREFVKIANDPCRREAMIARLSQLRLIEFFFGSALLLLSGLMSLIDRSSLIGYMTAFGVFQIAICMNRDATIKRAASTLKCNG